MQFHFISAAWNSIEQLCFWWIFPIFTLFSPERALLYLWLEVMAHVLNTTQSLWIASPLLVWLSQLDISKVIHKGTLKHENELRISQKGTCSALDQPHINQHNEQQFHETTFPFSNVTPACFTAEDGHCLGMNQACWGKEAGFPVTPGALESLS